MINNRIEPAHRLDLLKTDSIIFDLDGTLWDTCASCATAWNNVLERHGIAFRQITDDDVRRVTGLPHAACIEQVFGSQSRQIQDLLIKETMIEDNRVIAERGGDLYPGVASGVQALSARYPLFIVSNCQSGYIETFFSFSGLAPCFRDFECWGNTQQPKRENLRAIIRRNKLQHAVLVGDHENDRSAAKDAGVPFVFVEYGFGRVDGADLSFNTFSELVDWFSFD